MISRKITTLKFEETILPRKNKLKAVKKEKMYQRINKREYALRIRQSQNHICATVTV